MKHVEHVFGVLQTRWTIVRHPSRTWDVHTMHEVMIACMVMHNIYLFNYCVIRNNASELYRLFVYLDILRN
jgi:hypothetical protein